MNIQAVMITMEGREDSAQETSRFFENLGIPVEIFVQPHDWEIGQASNNRNSARAIQWFLENTKGDDLLFLEDDLIVHPKRLERALWTAKEKGEISYLYMHDVPARKDRYPNEPWIQEMFRLRQYRPGELEAWQEKATVPEGLRRVPSSAHTMFGSQCVFMPRAYCKFLLDEMTYAVKYTKKVKSQPSRAMDTALNDFRENHNLESFVYLPHPVQHLENRTRRKVAPKRTSLSFPLASDKDSE